MSPSRASARQGHGQRQQWVGIAWSGLGVEMRRKGRLGQSVRGKPQMGFGFKDDKRGAFDQRIQFNIWCSFGPMQQGREEGLGLNALTNTP